MKSRYSSLYAFSFILLLMIVFGLVGPFCVSSQSEEMTATGGQSAEMV